MNTHANDFVYGRSLVKKLLIASVICCAVSIFMPQQSYIQMAAVALTLIMFVTTIVCMVKYCRCPHCGKIIFTGVLAIKQCPRCHRSLETGKKMKKAR